jgi:hypothetical protein
VKITARLNRALSKLSVDGSKLDRDCAKTGKARPKWAALFLTIYIQSSKLEGVIVPSFGIYCRRVIRSLGGNRQWRGLDKKFAQVEAQLQKRAPRPKHRATLYSGSMRPRNRTDRS